MWQEVTLEIMLVKLRQWQSLKWGAERSHYSLIICWETLDPLGSWRVPPTPASTVQCWFVSTRASCAIWRRWFLAISCRCCSKQKTWMFFGVWVENIWLHYKNVIFSRPLLFFFSLCVCCFVFWVYSLLRVVAHLSLMLNATSATSKAIMKSTVSIWKRAGWAWSINLCKETSHGFKKAKLLELHSLWKNGKQVTHWRHQETKSK